MAVKECTGCRVLVWDKDPKAVEKALSSGAADCGDGDLSECGLIFLALYPGAVAEYLEEHIGQVRPGAVVTDLCGIKRFVCARLAPLCRGRGVHFISAHPMAGRETSGFDSALPTLYRGASVVLALDGEEDGKAVEALEGFFYTLGFGRVVRSDPDTHDEIIAYTSQLAHIASSAYVKSPEAQKRRGFSAGSFRDMTRVARLDEKMWTELFLDNADHLTEELGILIGHLNEYLAALESRDADALRALLPEGRELKATAGGN